MRAPGAPGARGARGARGAGRARGARGGGPARATGGARARLLGGLAGPGEWEALAGELLAGGAPAPGPGAPLSGCWRMLYTTEKETNFLLDVCGGTAAYQIIDVERASLRNVVEWGKERAFVVDSEISLEEDDAGGGWEQGRVNFAFTAAGLKLGSGPTLPVPPFGKGWFDTVYLDEELRISKDVRGDTLVVKRCLDDVGW